jgi:hypothetical protein
MKPMDEPVLLVNEVEAASKILFAGSPQIAVLFENQKEQ